MNTKTILVVPARRRAISQLLGAGGLALCGSRSAWGAADGAKWPTHVIRFIVPSAAGGPADIMGRLIAERMARNFGVPVVVDNRPGGTGAVALDAIAKAAPDGHTVGISFTGASIIYPLLNKRLPFNVESDFSPIGMIGEAGGMLLVNPSVPVRTFGELKAYVEKESAKGPVAYGSWGNGSGGHLAGEALRLQTGWKLHHVPYRSTTALATDMVGGHMPIGFLDLGSAAPLIKADKLRAIVQITSERSAAFPDVPTLREEGLKFGLRVWYGMIGPAGLPAPIIERYNRELNTLMSDPQFAERVANFTGNPPKGSTPAQFAGFIEEDRKLIADVIERAGITLE